MRMLSKINRRFLLTSIILFAVCSLLLFFMISYVIHADLKENLLDERAQIEHTFKKTGQLPVPHNLKSDRIEIQKVSITSLPSPRWSNSMIYDSLEQEYIPHTQLSFFVSDKNGTYQIDVSQSRLESDDLIISLMIFTLIFISALLAIIYFINRSLSKSIWLPFNETLEKLRSFDLTGRGKVSFSKSSIAEFEELNQSLNKMTEKIYLDYSRLKEFTENASHETQTPLSIMRSKLELLIQAENLTQEQLRSIQKINEAVSKLSRLNSALLTLTKIENRQFRDAEEIPLDIFIRKKLSDLEEWIMRKNISVTVQADEAVILKINPFLADLLFDNLIINAIRHNIENGTIHIALENHLLSISNTGAPLQMPAEKLFDRFAKNNPSSDSLGLGLAIVQQICVNYDFDLHFTSEKNLHTISIAF